MAHTLGYEGGKMASGLINTLGFDTQLEVTIAKQVIEDAGYPVEEVRWVDYAATGCYYVDLAVSIPEAKLGRGQKR